MAARTKPPKNPVCTPMELPEAKLVKAAATAISVNPNNRPRVRGIITAFRSFLDDLDTEAAKDVLAHLDRTDEHEVADGIATPQHIALITTKYWGSQGVDLSVSFLEKTNPPLSSKILQYMNRWGERANVTFRLTNGQGDVRISRGSGGYWSYLGTDIRHIPAGQQTMNLEGFTLATPDSEYERVVTHETGHTLGCPHEHMRPALVALLDPAKTIAYFGRTQGWSAQEVQEQILTPLDERTVMATPPDQDSIMCYQIPGSCTKNGQPIRGGATINESDFAFMAQMYPKQVVTPPPVNPPPGGRQQLVVVLDVDPATKTAAVASVT